MRVQYRDVLRKFSVHMHFVYGPEFDWEIG
jgi:hypothetical protein